MLLFTNTGTKAINIHYANDVITIQPGGTTYITPEQLHKLKDTCPDAVYTVAVAGPTPPVPTNEFTGIAIGSALTDTTGALFWIKKTIQEDGTETTGYVGVDGITAYTPSGVIRPANNDREFIKGDKCFTNGTDEFRLIIGINKSSPSDQSDTKFWINQTTGVRTAIQPAGLTPCPEPVVPLINNNGAERRVRLDGNTPVQQVTSSQIKDILYDSVNITNMSGQDDMGEYRPFRGQDGQNTTVVWLEIEFFSPALGSNYTERYALPPGSKLIAMEGASVVQINRIAVMDNIDADLSNNNNNLEIKGFSNGQAPSTPINLLFTFNLSV